jgi:hypothetical protein
MILVRLLSIFLATTFPSLGRAASTPPPVCAPCLQCAKRFLRDPALPLGDPAALLITPDRYVSDLHWWKFSVQTPRGGGGTLSVDHTRHQVVTAMLYGPHPYGALQPLPVSELSAQALAFCRRQYPQYLQPAARVRLRKADVTRFAGQEIELGFVPEDADGFALGPSLFVNIRLNSGIISGCRLFPAQRTTHPPIRVRRAQAQERACAQAARQLGVPARMLEVITECTVVEKVGEVTQYQYRFLLLNKRTNGHGSASARLPGAEVTIDAHTGQVLTLTPRSLSAGDVQHARETVETQLTRLCQPHSTCQDRWPSWAPDGQALFCRSTRIHTAAPWWNRLWGVMRCEPSTEAMAWVEPGWNVGPQIRGEAESLVVLDGPPRVIFANSHGDCQQLDLTTGTITRIGGPADVLGLLHAVGATLTGISAPHTGDSDIYVVDLVSPTGRPSKLRRVAQLPGEDFFPVLSPDEQTVYFAHARVPGGSDELKDTELYRVSARGYWDEHAAPERIGAGWGRLNRLSPFPDGRRLLVTANDGTVEIVTLADGTRHCLPLSSLRDPEAGARLEVHDATLNPDGTRVAFSGRWVDRPTPGTAPTDLLIGDIPVFPQEIYRIYTCTLEGQDLRRVTPLVEAEVPPFRFPGTQESAQSLAYRRLRAWAPHQVPSGVLTEERP